MTQEGSGPPGQDGVGDDREARLRALLSVSIARREREEADARAEASAEPPVDAPEEAPAAPAEATSEDAQATGEPAPDPAPEPPAETALEPAVETAPDPALEPPVETASDPAAEPAADPEPEPRRGWWSDVPVGGVVSVVVLVGLFALGIGLTYVGTRIIRSSTEGEVLEPVDDPAAPGFEALVEPTPTLALLHDVGGEIDAITVLTLPDPSSGGGGVVFVPTRVIQDVPPFGPTPIETAYNFGTPQVQAEAVGDLLGVGMSEIAVVDAAHWAGLVAPVAPLTVDNPDDLVVDGEVRFPAGEIQLEAEDVGPFLEARPTGQSDLARLYRHETFWRAWLTAVAEAGGAGAVPGELESGVGRFVRTLAAGRAVVERLPVQQSSSDEHGEEPAFDVEPDAVAGLVAELVPFPRTPRPGVRERVRVLNGTTDLEAARRVAPTLPPVGVEVVIVGNAAALDRETTTIAYVGPEHEEAAREIRDVLGVGEVLQDPRPSDVADITVTLGADHD